MLEIIVVDNASIDDSIEFLDDWRKGGLLQCLIKNKKNVGFSAAINQGIKRAKSKNILLLNMPKYRLKVGDIDRYIATLGKDKKNTGQQLRCILTRGFGKMVIETIEIDGALSEIIIEYCSDKSC